MRRTTIRNAADIQRMTLQEATDRFIKYCKVKNLREQTIAYYVEDCGYFAAHTEAEYIDEVNYELLEDFIFQEIENGKKVSSLNTRIHGLRVFFNFCADREPSTAEGCIVSIVRSNAKMNGRPEKGGRFVLQ